MTPVEFTATILPALGRFDVLDLNGLGADGAELLWVASRPHGEWPPADKHAVLNAQDALLGLIPEVAVHLARELRTNYEALKHADAGQVTQVRVTTPADCHCLAGLDGVQLPVAAALRAFAGDIFVPLLPPPEAPCLRCESPTVCAVRVVPARYTPQPGDDPEFAEVLKGILALPAKPLPEYWADRIRKAVPSK